MFNDLDCVKWHTDSGLVSDRPTDSRLHVGPSEPEMAIGWVYPWAGLGWIKKFGPMAISALNSIRSHQSSDLVRNDREYC